MVFNRHALKRLKSNVAQEMEALKSMEKLKHEYIVTFHGYFVHEKKVYIVMDYCDVSIRSFSLHSLNNFFSSFNHNLK